MSKPVGLYAIDPSTGHYITYMLIWYVMQALGYLEFRVSGMLPIGTLPCRPRFSVNLVQKLPSTNLVPEMRVFGWTTYCAKRHQDCEQGPCIWERPDAYFPIWYVGHVLETFGMDAEWNGQTHKWNVV